MRIKNIKIKEEGSTAVKVEESTIEKSITEFALSSMLKEESVEEEQPYFLPADESAVPSRRVEVCRSDRAKCTNCNNFMKKGSLKIGTWIENFQPLGYAMFKHLACYSDRQLQNLQKADCDITQASEMGGYENLSDEHKRDVDELWSASVRIAETGSSGRIVPLSFKKAQKALKIKNIPNNDGDVSVNVNVNVKKSKGTKRKANLQPLSSVASNAISVPSPSSYASGVSSPSSATKGPEKKKTKTKIRARAKATVINDVSEEPEEPIEPVAAVFLPPTRSGRVRKAPTRFEA